ncbi:hypothetical protein [Microbacterium sp. p3-SID336]|uniref:hypothetical protein n=1 Tax=Microbacterium sp. p3-SID336 TaxID=2916212 RepID=UPI0021A73F24|nr:hypothetical protein [Microbacterium sp. p3-SID336]MCT1479373.1 hypothetical protein [Microbacterium sp. p3-SID336]
MTDKLFVLIGSADDATTSRLQAREVRYRQKNLNSGMKNWGQIVEDVAESRGTIVRLNRHNFEQFAGPELSGHSLIPYDSHHQLTSAFVAAVARVPHLVLVHEHILAGATWTSEQSPSWTYSAGDVDERLSEAARNAVLSAFENAGVTLTPYRRNAEAAELASAFIDDNESELLLRIYLPSALPHSDQASRLISLFREWLTNVRHMGVRLSSHKTSRGEVIEFFAGDGTSVGDFDRELVAFQNYVDAIATPDAATALLRGFGVDERSAADFVDRHRMLLRRIQIDMNHEQERRELAHRQSAESELVELVAVDAPLDVLRSLVRQVLPMHAGPEIESRGAAPVVINSQAFHAVYGDVQQTVGIGGLPAEVARVFHEMPDGDRQIAHLAELADADLPRSRRTQAAAGVRAFLLRAKDRLETEAFRVAFAWINSQLDL